MLSATYLPAAADDKPFDFDTRFAYTGPTTDSGGLGLHPSADRSTMLVNSGAPDDELIPNCLLYTSDAADE